MSEKAVILAVAPAWLASKIHLYAEGYEPGRKARRSLFRMSLCGQGRIADDAVLMPIGEALARGWTVRTASPQDPRPQWSWCRNCVGHGLDLAGLTRIALDHLAQAEVRRIGDPTDEFQDQEIASKES